MGLIIKIWLYVLHLFFSFCLNSLPPPSYSHLPSLFPFSLVFHSESKTSCGFSLLCLSVLLWKHGGFSMTTSHLQHWARVECLACHRLWSHSHEEQSTQEVDRRPGWSLGRMLSGRVGWAGSWWPCQWHDGGQLSGGERSCPGIVSPGRVGVSHHRKVYSSHIRKVHPVLPMLWGRQMQPFARGSSCL